MPVALHGNLRDFGIGEVFQLIGQQQKTGILEVSDDETRLRIAFDGGAVVWGERVGAYEGAALGDMLVRSGLITPQRLVELERRIGDGAARLEAMLIESGELSAGELDEVVSLVTRDTLFELLRWTRGSFHFSAGPVVHGRDPASCIPAEQLLMDGLRMVDEWRTFDEGALDPEAVFAPSGRFEDFRRAHPGELPERLAVAERLFLLIDGRQPVRRLVDLSRLGSFEGTRWLTLLRRARLIERVDPELVARKQRRRHTRELASMRPPLGGALLALLPWVLLAFVLLALAEGPAPRLAAPERLSERAALHQAGAFFEVLRLGHLADAHRYALGRWPAGLTDLRRFYHEARRQVPLAPLDAREYYFARRGDGFLVLAPEEE
jgi:hypothetical protein